MPDYESDKTYKVVRAVSDVSLSVEQAWDEFSIIYGYDNDAESCYFDVDKAGRSDNCAEAKSTQQMKSQSTFAGWDFHSHRWISGVFSRRT